jgi:hypothetical protein
MVPQTLSVRFLSHLSSKFSTHGRHPQTNLTEIGPPKSVFGDVDTCFFPLRHVPHLEGDERCNERDQDKKALAKFAKFIEKQGGDFDKNKAEFVIIPPYSKDHPNGVSVNNSPDSSLMLFLDSTRSLVYSRYMYGILSSVKISIFIICASRHSLLASRHLHIVSTFTRVEDSNLKASSLKDVSASSGGTRPSTIVPSSNTTVD